MSHGRSGNCFNAAFERKCDRSASDSTSKGSEGMYTGHLNNIAAPLPSHTEAMLTVKPTKSKDNHMQIMLDFVAAKTSVASMKTQMAEQAAPRRHETQLSLSPQHLLSLAATGL